MAMSESIDLPTAPKFPKVTLDITLSELYDLDNPTNNHNGVLNGNNHNAISHKPVLINAFPCSDHALTSHIPCNVKFLYQDSEIHKPYFATSETELIHTRKILAAKLLGVLGQRYTFAAGDMDIVMLDPEAGRDDGLHALRQVSETTEVFEEGMRPRVHIVSGLEEFDKPELRGRKFMESMPFDHLQNLPHSLDPEIHYALLSKGLLAVSELPTPKSEVVTVNSPPEVIRLVEKYGAGFFPERMRDLTEHEIYEMKRLLSNIFVRLSEDINGRKIPFVVKTQQSSSGGGTFILRTENERKTFLENLAVKILPRLLSFISNENAHLNPADIIISEYIGAVYSDGLTFFVRRNGEPVFIGCARHEFDDEGFWTGGTITYSEQTSLKKKYQTVMDAVAKFLSGKGYYEPVGVDLLEDSKGGKFIVDMNVRVPGSLPLGVLKGHCYDKRGFNKAFIILAIKFNCDRTGFYERWKTEFMQGRLVIVAWYEEVEYGLGSWANLVMTAEDEGRLHKLIGRIGDFSIG